MPRFCSGPTVTVAMCRRVMLPAGRARGSGRAARPSGGGGECIHDRRADAGLGRWSCLANAGNAAPVRQQRDPGAHRRPDGRLRACSTCPGRSRSWSSGATSHWRSGSARRAGCAPLARCSALRSRHSTSPARWERTGRARSASCALSNPGPEGGERPDDASHPPLEGVTYDRWVEVRGGPPQGRRAPDPRRALRDPPRRAARALGGRRRRVAAARRSRPAPEGVGRLGRAPLSGDPSAARARSAGRSGSAAGSSASSMPLRVPSGTSRDEARSRSGRRAPSGAATRKISAMPLAVGVLDDRARRGPGSVVEVRQRAAVAGRRLDARARPGRRRSRR